MLNNPFMYYLFDYADVISLPQDKNCYKKMSELLGMSENSFHKAYWMHRRPYDLGLAGKEYWPRVAGRELSANELQSLILLDCQSWGRINPLTISYVKTLREKNHRLGILSNLPIELVHYLRENYSFLPLFHDVFFSAEIHKVKPDREAFAHVLDRLNVPAEEMTFFDDKEENLEGAKALGMKTFHITPESLKERFV